jgi:hypothetical protein
MPDPNTPPPRVSILRCLTCGDTAEARPADLMGFVRSGWPKCCGEVKTLFTPTDPADVIKNLTPPAQPGLPDGPTD